MPYFLLSAALSRSSLLKSGDLTGFAAASAGYSGRSARRDADRLDRRRQSRIERSSGAFGFASVARPRGAGQPGNRIGLRVSLRRQRGRRVARGARFDRNSGLRRWQTHLRNRNDSFAGAIPPSACRVRTCRQAGCRASSIARALLSPGCQAGLELPGRSPARSFAMRRGACPSRPLPTLPSADRRSSPPTRPRPAAGPSASPRSASELGLGPSAFLLTSILAALAITGSLVLSYLNSRALAQKDARIGIADRESLHGRADRHGADRHS